MKCYVQWEGQGEWRGPFRVDAYDRTEGYANIDLGGEYEDWISTIPISWTLGIDDGWTIWEGGECPVEYGVQIDTMLVSGESGITNKGPAVYWGHDVAGGKIIAYRIVEPKVRRLEPIPADIPPLSVILDRTLWWEDDRNEWRSVEAWDTEAEKRQFRLTPLGDFTYVSIEWFRGRRHLAGAELAEELGE